MRRDGDNGDGQDRPDRGGQRAQHEALPRPVGGPRLQYRGDAQLPEVSGLEVTKWIKDDPELHAIPVIAITAFAMKGDEERIRQGGCEAYLSKPISVAKFIETIRQFLGAPQGERQ